VEDESVEIHVGGGEAADDRRENARRERGEREVEDVEGPLPTACGDTGEQT
jgi:hypothetical protein